jgi:uncharacterized membrane protein
MCVSFRNIKKEPGNKPKSSPLKYKSRRNFLSRNIRKTFKSSVQDLPLLLLLLVVVVAAAVLVAAVVVVAVAVVAVALVCFITFI